MSEQIGVGDKVMLVWGCCAQHRQRIGHVATVAEIFTNVEGRCQSCNRHLDATFARLDDQPPYRGFPLAWLKKMPPEGEQVDERETQEISA